MITSVRTYARARMNALGYKEWSDGFNSENIPRTKLDAAYHIETGVVRGTGIHQNNQDIEVPFTIRFFKAQGRDPKALIDQAETAADTVIAAFLKATNRLVNTNPKNISFQTFTLEPLADSNDNGVIVKIEFTALVVISTL